MQKFNINQFKTGEHFIVSDNIEENYQKNNQIITKKIVQLKTPQGYLELADDGTWNFFPYA